MILMLSQLFFDLFVGWLCWCSTHFRSFRARSVNLAILFLGKPPMQFTSP